MGDDQYLETSVNSNRRIQFILNMKINFAAIL